MPLKQFYRPWLFCALLATPQVVTPQEAASQASAQQQAALAAERDLAQTRRRGAKITRLVFNGHRGIEESALIAKVKSRPGQKYSQKTIRQDVQNLFETGFFNDIQVDLTKGVLSFNLTQRPRISEFHFHGNKALKEDELLEALGVKTFTPLDRHALKQASQRIKNLYSEKGFLLATVRLQSQIKNDTAEVHFYIREHKRLTIKGLQFIGEPKLPRKTLMSRMQSKLPGPLSFLSRSGTYKPEVLANDMQRLRHLYYNKGYVQVQLSEPEVTVLPNQKDVYISISIAAGPVFSIGDISYAPATEGEDLIFSTDKLQHDVFCKPGELFQYDNLQGDLRRLMALYGDLGYAYANIVPQTRLHDNKVDIQFQIHKGKKVYVNRIHIKGNSKTRDKVIRREIKLKEAQLYNESFKRQSVSHVQRLGFFEEVKSHNQPQGDNKIDVEFVVKERSTGSIHIAAGYSDYAGIGFQGQINQSNFLGRGQSLGASLDYSKSQKLYSLNFTEPYFLDSQWSLNLDLHRQQRELADYNELKQGGGMRVGHPLGTYLHAAVGYKIDNNDIKSSNTDSDIFDSSTTNGISSALTGSVFYDRRNDRLFPTEGSYVGLDVEYSGLGGDLYYTTSNLSLRYYKTLFWDVVWRNNASYGWVFSNKADKAVPFNQLFLLGGAFSLRGYPWFSVGRHKFSQAMYDSLVKQEYSAQEARQQAMRPYGGQQQLMYNTELLFPLIKEVGFMGVLFYDIGAAQDSPKWQDFRSNVGFGFRWFSPIGPLRFEWGYPINRRKNEAPTVFTFMVGSPF